MKPAWRSRVDQDRERGATAVVLAVSLGAVLMATALVIDLGSARDAQSRNSSVADAVSIAGASELTFTHGNSNKDACDAAWAYIKANYTSTASLPSTAPSCSDFATSCDPAVERRVTATRGDYRFTFVNPVTNSSDLMDGRNNPAIDLTPCYRFGVRIEQAKDNLFTSGDINVVAKAVSRLGGATVAVNAPLVIVEPQGCRALELGGSGGIVVESVVGVTGVEQPGVVVVDSDGTNGAGADCDATDPVVTTSKSGGTGSASLTIQDAPSGAPAELGTFGLSTHGVGAAGTFRPSQVASGQLPAPTATPQQIGTEFIEREYNCKAANNCKSGDPAHIDVLVSQVGGSGWPAPLGGVPFKKFSDHYNCNGGADIVAPAGYWWIDCALSGNRNVRFQEGVNILVFDKGVDVKRDLVVNCNAGLTCNPADANQSIMYFRQHGSGSGSPWVFDGGKGVYLNETFVYMEKNTLLDLNGVVTKWTAPNNPAFRFHNLAVWSESTAVTEMTGSSDLVLEGTFFLPYAELNFDGSASTGVLNAQLVVRRLTTDGSSTLRFRADPNRVNQPYMPSNAQGSTLIR